MACDAVHPSLSLRCTATESHDEHRARSEDGKTTEWWPNTDWRPPPRQGDRRVTAEDKAELKALGDLVPPKATSRPVNTNTIAIGHDHPETSHEMTQRVFPKTGTQRRLVYDLALRHGEEGVTDDEIEIALDMLHQSASAARNSLMNDGWLVDGGIRRPTRRGFAAIAWVAVPE